MRGAPPGAPTGARGAAAAAGSFGSEGAASVRDLGVAFTRAIPMAAGSDPLWSAQGPLGDSGKLEVAVHVDGTGHITSAEPLGARPRPALASLVRRILPLLQAGTFAVREGVVGEGTEVLELRAMASDVPVAADSAGVVIDLSFEYANGRGKAGFTQPTGRRVEVTVKVIGQSAAR